MESVQDPNELIVPVEFLRECAASANSRTGLDWELYEEIAIIARDAVVERGLLGTPKEIKCWPSGVVHYIAFCLRDKADFTPEEQTMVAAGLRDFGKFAYHSPQSVFSDPEKNSLARG